MAQSEERAAHYKNAEKVEGTLEVRRSMGLNERLAALAAAVRADRRFESPWELLRFGLFKGMTHGDAAGALGEWARRQRILLEFEARRIGSVDAVFVVLQRSKNRYQIPSPSPS